MDQSSANAELQPKNYFGQKIWPNVHLSSARQRVKYSAELWQKIWRQFCGSAFVVFCINLKSLDFIVTVVYLLLVPSYLLSKQVP